MSLADFEAAHPDGDVLSRETGFTRDYGRNPYVGYDTVDQNSFLFDGVLDGRLPPKERVVTWATARRPSPSRTPSFQRFGVETVRGTLIQARLTQQELAEMIGTTRETLATPWPTSGSGIFSIWRATRS